MQVGWIGTGALGSAIVKKISKSYQINVWNRTSKKANLLMDYGVKVYYDLNFLAKDCDVVFLCLKGEEVYTSVLFGKSGLANHLSPNSIVIDLSTINPSLSIYIYKELIKKNIHYIECPVSGGPEGALKGQLTAITAGDENKIREITPIIEKFSSEIHFVGNTGKAQTIKVLNNLAESINLLGAAEVINMGVKLGFSPEILQNVLTTTRGYSVYMGVLLERILNPTSEISASLSIRLKDIELANSLATDIRQPIPLGSLSKELFKLSIVRCGEEADQTNCFNLYNNYKGEMKNV
ncbi:NAD(P)-dependent oxidoreductase [Priestia flexa]|uniref:NAD(P)-dependent oxidoreductase n=1 Tax=Priestia flexa TaxID=86664 RepID=UPI00077CBC58|nr:NAD(P)-dependent oxidoreductase [Priestia flexa]MED4590502.1 NAD(P)-dependent oxidoreductase [Priestia flexa]